MDGLDGTGIVWVADPHPTGWPNRRDGNPVDRFDLRYPSQETRLCMEVSDRIAARLIALETRGDCTFIPLLVVVDGPLGSTAVSRLDQCAVSGGKVGVMIVRVAR